MTTNPLFENYLEQLERQFEQISGALAMGDPVALEEYSAAMQRLSVELVGFLDSNASAGLMATDVSRRVKKLSAKLPLLREVLYRRSAHVDMALQTLVPAASQRATYASESAKSGAVYGTIPRKSGTFQMMSA